jgi:hypothetical protein
LQAPFKINAQPVPINQDTITISGVTKKPVSDFGLFCFDLFAAMYSSVEFEPITQLERAALLVKTMIEVATTVHG